MPAALRGQREQVQYLAVGVWNTFFGYCVWALLQYGLQNDLNYLVIVVLSYPIAIANAYVCYRYIVFQSQGPIVERGPAILGEST